MEASGLHNVPRTGQLPGAVIVEFMVASPADVEPLHSNVRHAIERWNRCHGFSRGVQLLVRTWKSDLAPEVDSRAQNIPNRRLLPRTSVLIAIFWTRLGTSTGLYKSGTVEEIALHTAAGKRVMIYFADLPARPSRIDPGQLKALTEFREEWSAKAFVACASTAEELEQRLYADLEVLMNEPEFAELGPPQRAIPEARATLEIPRGNAQAAPPTTSAPAREPGATSARSSLSAQQIEQAAAEWVARIDLRGSSEDWLLLDEFLAADPRHRAAYLRLSVAWRRADQLKKFKPLDGVVDPDLFSSDRLGPAG